MLDRRALLVPFFLAQGLAVHWLAGSERPPAPPALARFPEEFNGWKLAHEDPVASDVASVLRADQLLSRTYSDGQGSMAGLFVAWFRSQRGGASQPHSPKVCLPASGWTPETTGEVSLATAAGPITINRYVVANGGQRAVVLYWYQTPRRAIAGEWAAKLWVVADSIKDRRTDTALVRIVVWAGAGGDRAAGNTAAEFARELYPKLRDYLPR